MLEKEPGLSCRCMQASQLMRCAAAILFVHSSFCGLGWGSNKVATFCELSRASPEISMGCNGSPKELVLREAERMASGNLQLPAPGA